MAQFSMEISRPNGSVPRENQQSVYSLSQYKTDKKIQKALANQNR